MFHVKHHTKGDFTMNTVKFFEDGELYTWNRHDFLSSAYVGVYASDLGVEIYDLERAVLSVHENEDGTIIRKDHITVRLTDDIILHYLACIVDDGDDEIRVYYLTL